MSTPWTDDSRLTRRLQPKADVTNPASCRGLAVGRPVARAWLERAVYMIDYRLEHSTDASQRAAIIHEIGPLLHASWVRLIVDWRLLEPARGTYDSAEVGHLDALVDGLHAAKVKIILTTYSVPSWAQDSYWWKHPPAGYANGPQSFYAIRSAALGDYADLGQFLSTHFVGRVQALECWNEPNLWSYIYPQRTAGDEVRRQELAE